jgi:hypothetical protein
MPPGTRTRATAPVPDRRWLFVELASVRPKPTCSISAPGASPSVVDGNRAGDVRDERTPRRREGRHACQSSMALVSPISVEWQTASRSASGYLIRNAVMQQ